MTAAASNPLVDLVLVPPRRDLGDGFSVRRALPSARRRMVGPFIFFDQMGPVALAPGAGLDVRPHPHIGLATVTYLIEGEILHRDSLGSVQPIRPGEVNWMTAGRGIAHSERSPDATRMTARRLFGLQAWVALPAAGQEAEPAFEHYAARDIPRTERDGVALRLIAGRLDGLRSPVRTPCDLVYADLSLAEGASWLVHADQAERALYLVEGEVAIGGDDFSENCLIVLKPGRPVPLRAKGPARLMLLGGAPFPEPRHIEWNFVSTSLDRIERAKADWRAGRFPPVPGETERIPLPKAPVPVRYP